MTIQNSHPRSRDSRPEGVTKDGTLIGDVVLGPKSDRFQLLDPAGQWRTITLPRDRSDTNIIGQGTDVKELFIANIAQTNSVNSVLVIDGENMVSGAKYLVNPGETAHFKLVPFRGWIGGVLNLGSTF